MTHESRRRRGLALRCYRGAHRGRAWPVAALAEAVAAQAAAARRAHLASLRRPFDPRPVYVGSTVVNMRFYGKLPDPTDPAQIVATFTPPDYLTNMPAIAPRGPLFLGRRLMNGAASPEPAPTADDALTGPILVGGWPRPAWPPC